MDKFQMLVGSAMIVLGVVSSLRETISRGAEDEENGGGALLGTVIISIGVFLVVSSSSWRNAAAATVLIVSGVLGFGGGIIALIRLMRSIGKDPW